MNEIARLDMAVDSTDADKAAKSLDNLADFAEKAEKATGSLGESVQKSAKQYKNLSDMADDLARSERKAVEQVYQRARAYTQSASAELAAMRAADKNKNSMREYAAETEKLRQGLTKLLADIDPLEAKLNKLDETEQRLIRTFKSGVIDAEKYAESLAKIGAQRDDIAEKQLKQIGDGANYAAEMMEKLGLGTRQAQYDLLNLGRAAAQGNLSQVQSSIFNLTRGSGALTAALSATGLAATATLGSVSLLGAAYYKGYQQTQEFNRSIAITGNVMGVSAGNMARMTAEVGRLTGGYAEAEQAANLIVRSGRIAADSIQEVMQTAVDMQQSFGQSVDVTVSEFERLGGSPSRTLLELNEKYHFLTASVYKQVRALEDQGREEEAAKLAQAEYSRALGERASEVVENVGWMEKRWRGLKNVVTGAWEAIANVGKDSTLEDDLSGLKEELRQQEAFLKELEDAGERTGRPNLRDISQVEKNIDALNREVAAYEEGAAKLEVIGKLEQKIASERKRLFEQDQEGDRYLERNQPRTLEHELSRARENIERLTEGLSKDSERYLSLMDAFYREESEIRKRHEKTTSRAGNEMAAESARLRARIAEETDLSKVLENTVAQITRLNEFERRALQLREQAKTATNASTKAKLEELAALNEEAGALVRNNKLAEEAAKERLRYLDGLAKSAQSTREEAQRLRDQAQTMGMSRTALESLTTSRLKDQVAQLQGKEGTEEEIKLIQDLIAEREKLVQAISQREMAQESYRARQELERDWQRTIENIDDVFRRGFSDMLNQGEGTWKSWTKSLTTTFKTAVADQIYKMFMQPFVAQIAVGVTGGMGMGGAAGQNVAVGFDTLRMANNAYSAFSGGMTSSLSKGIGFLGDKLGSSALQSFSAGLGSTVGSLGAAPVLGSGITGITSVGSGAAASMGTTIGGTAWGSSLSGGAAGMGAALGAAMPWVTGGLALASLVPSISKMFKGETRSGGGFWHDVAGGQTHFGGGPSGGYGGSMDAMDQTLKAFAGSITGLFDALDIDAHLATTIGTFESSKKGRGGTSSGGLLVIDGHEIYFGSVGPQGQGRKGAGYGGKSGSAEEMFENMTRDMAYSTLEAWQLVADQMPPMLNEMLSGIDVRSLAVEQAESLAGEIHQIVGSVNALTAALDEMPLENLRDLSFEVSHGLIEMAGGVEALLGGVSTYYQGFYSEAERHEQLLSQLQSQFSDLNTTMPMSRQAFRSLADGLDVSTEAGQRLYVSLMEMSGAAAQFYSYVEAQAAQAWSTIESEMRASHQQYLDYLRERHQSALKAVRDEYAERNKLFRESLAEASEKIRDLGQVVRSLESGIGSLRQQSSLAESIYRDSGRRLVDDALEMARAGKSLVGFDGLTDAVNAVSKLSTSDFASQFEFELERAESVAALKELEGLTGGQIDLQQIQADLLEKQIEELSDWRDRQIEQLERQFKASQTFAEVQFERQLELEQKRFEREIEEMLTQQALQSDANAALLHANGISQHGFNMVESAIHASASRIASAVSSMSVDVNLNRLGGARLPAFADGGHYRGGLALVGERGPEIINFAQPAMVYSNAQSKNLMANAGEGNAEVIALLRQLLSETSGLRVEVRQMVFNTAKIMGLVDDATEGAASNDSVIVMY